LPESLLGALNAGDEVQVRSAYSGHYFTAKVNQVSRQMHRKTQGYMVQATPVEEINLVHGSTVKISFQDQSPKYFQVPATAVKRNGVEAFVFVKKDPVEEVIEAQEEETEVNESTEHGSENMDTEAVQVVQEIKKVQDPIVEKLFVEIRAIEGEFAQIMGNVSEDMRVVTSFPDRFINLQNDD
jgi:glycogen debranching enzyme